MPKVFAILFLSFVLCSCDLFVRKAAEEVNDAIAKRDSLGEANPDYADETEKDFFSPQIDLVESKMDGKDTLYLIRQNYLNGQKFSEGWVRNRSREGVTHYYHIDGTPLCTVVFRNNNEYSVSDGRDKAGNPLNFGDLRNGNGTLKFHDPFSDKLLSSVIFKNSKREGEFSLYYHTGELFKKGTFKNDAVEGDFVEYFKNGSVREKGTYQNATQSGDHVAYFRSGRIRITESWVNGKPVMTEEYDHTGKMLRNGRMSNGKYCETHFNYNSNGDLESKGEFRDGLKHGPYEYMKHGNVIRREMWNNDTLMREMVWYTSGEKEALIVYKNDQRDSIYTEYYMNGSLRIQQGYKEGTKHGVYCSYYDNGQIYIKGKYKDGSPDGKFDCYTKEGKYKGNYIPQDKKQ